VSLVELVLLVVAVSWTVVIGAALWVRHRLRRRLRPAPGVRSGAPLRWLVVPSGAAARHRRLRAAVALAPPGPPRRRLPATAVDELVVDLHRVAADLDQRIVVAARCPREVRARELRTLDPELAELARTARRLAVLHDRAGHVAGPDIASELDERLAALESAVAEIDAAETRVLGHEQLTPGGATEAAVAARADEPEPVRRHPPERPAGAA